MTSILERMVASAFDIRGLIPSVKVALAILIPYAIYLLFVGAFQWENAQTCALWDTPMFFWWSCP